jgi:predicted dehydrogenase
MPANKAPGTAGPLRVILVGAGRHGYAAYVEDAFPPLVAAGLLRPVAVAEPDPTARARALVGLGLQPAQGFSDLRAALASTPADSLVIASPYAVHEEACLLGVRAGLHLFIEKPVCGDLPACCRVEHAVTAAGLKAAVNMSARFEPEKISFAEALRSGTVGRVEYLFARLAWNHGQTAGFRALTPHPYLTEAGVHFLDLLRACAGGRPRRVHNLAWRSPASIFQGYASTVVSIEFDSGVCAVLEGSWSVRATLGFWRDEYLRADGENGSLMLDQRKLSRLRSPMAAPQQAVAELVPCATSGPSGTRRLLTDFVSWTRGETPDHPTALSDNLQTMAMLYAANHSAETGLAVDVAGFLAAARENGGSPQRP